MAATASPAAVLHSKPFGYYVFDDKAMEKHVPDAAYKRMKQFILKGGVLDPTVADAVAFGMKEWATVRGATSFTHWFHPLNDKTAVKYDAFLVLKNHLGYSGRNLSQFTGKQLVQGEPDGSSFPNGGLRKTAEARGYTAWDYTSPPFVMDSCLYIPAVFCSVFGLSLDVRTPMLKSEYAVSEASLRALRLIRSAIAQDDPEASKPVSKQVYVTMGPEQELFIIDRAKFERRPDLVNTGRVLLGAAPLRGQQLEDHYWGAMPLRVRKVLEDVQERLWGLGVPIVTCHNEVAPAQFEMASCYERASVASDHNMITMQVMLEECEKHNLAALVHEKPFSRYVNGSGKHTNWSLATSDGENLFAPGDEPQKSTQFLFFLAAFIRAAHVHTDVLRTAIAVPGNEFRLGGMEAPPAIISVFLGEFLDEVVREIIAGPAKKPVPESPSGRTATPSPGTFLDLGLSTLPKVQLDGSDRNRTSPLAFVGNRFEFRAVGASQNCAWPVTALNTIVADSLAVMCDQYEEELTAGIAPRDALAKVIRQTLKAHEGIIYNGDCYEQEYVEEMAKKRGLPNIPSCPAAIALFNSQKNRDMFARANVMTHAEVEARSHVLAERYCATRAIEATTLVNIIETSVIPAGVKFQERLSNALREAVALLGDNAAPLQKKRLGELVAHIEELIAALAVLKEAMVKAPKVEDGLPRAWHYRDEIMPAMERVKVASDVIESTVDRDLWPMPTISDLFASF